MSGIKFVIAKCVTWRVQPSARSWTISIRRFVSERYAREYLPVKTFADRPYSVSSDIKLSKLPLLLRSLSPCWSYYYAHKISPRLLSFSLSLSLLCSAKIYFPKGSDIRRMWRLLSISSKLAAIQIRHCCFAYLWEYSSVSITLVFGPLCSPLYSPLKNWI